MYVQHVKIMFTYFKNMVMFIEKVGAIIVPQCFIVK